MFIVALEKKRLAGGSKATIWSMVDFRCAEYSDGKVMADKETRKRIVEVGIRQVARETGIVRNTIRLITRGAPVKPITLAKVVRFLTCPPCG